MNQKSQKKKKQNWPSTNCFTVIAGRHSESKMLKQMVPKHNDNTNKSIMHFNNKESKKK